MKERVQKLMAQADIGSRRACEAIIREGRVRVNGQVITLGAKADPETDTITVDGARLAVTGQQKVYIAFYKPNNVLSTNVGHKGDDRKTVREFVSYEGHLFTIGRLDVESEGLMVLTNDGDTTNRLTHPRYRHTKTYRVEVYGMPSTETINQWEQGVLLEEGKTAPCSVRITHGSNKVSTLQVVMTEGKKRQIRRVAAMLGHPVKRLTRTHIGKLGLGTLRPGETRELNAHEVRAMMTPADEFPSIKQGKTGVKPVPNQASTRTARGKTGARTERDKTRTRTPRGKTANVRRPGRKPSGQRNRKRG